MAVTKESVREALGRVRLPGAGGGVPPPGLVRKVAVCDGLVSITLAGGGLTPAQRDDVARQAAAGVRESAQRAGDQIADVHVQFSEEAPGAEPGGAGAGAGGPGVGVRARPPQPAGAGAGGVQGAGALPGVRHAIAVGAGKGGVGKSTIAVNLAVGLARRGHAVGLLDGDIYGPSLPTMLGLGTLDPVLIQGSIQPFAVHGVKAMTIGKLVDAERALIWRGPMAHGAFKQLTEQTNWGELDYLIIDLPPGTGDVALTMAQTIRLAGAVVVCTPQKVAQDDAIRAARMFQQLNVEILGVVENMSVFVGDDGKEYDLFGRGGAQRMAQRLGVPFLGAVPITMGLRERSDSGDPTGNFEGKGERDAALAKSLETLVTNLETQVALASFKSGARGPTLTVS